jgi:hypothetical protein
MRSKNLGDKFASRQIKEGHLEQVWIEEQVKIEIGRLTVILRNPVISEEDKAITQSQIGDYQEMVVIVPGTADDWIQQICFLVDPPEDQLV